MNIKDGVLKSSPWTSFPKKKKTQQLNAHAEHFWLEVE